MPHPFRPIKSPIHLSHKCPIPISHYVLTSHFMCEILNIDVPVVLVLPHSTQLQHHDTLWNFNIHHDTSRHHQTLRHWDIMRHSDITTHWERHYYTMWDIVRHSGTQFSHYEILWDTVKQYATTWDKGTPWEIVRVRDTMRWYIVISQKYTHGQWT